MSALAQFRNTNPPPVSPTNTAYSGISNYRTDSYRPVRDTKGAPPVPALDARVIARTHFDELSLFLESHMAKEPPGSRASAREKLTRLTRQQFQELSTDVYDELVRRKNNTSKNEVPFLPVRDEFHPKRNQARQKLATLPKTRFKDLSSDVFVELGRRYPELKEPETLTPLTPGSVYDEPSPMQPIPPPPPVPQNPYSSQPNGGRSSDEQYRTSYGSPPNRRPSQERKSSRDDQPDRQAPIRSPTGESFAPANPGYRTTSPEPGPSTQRRPSSSSSYGARQNDGYGGSRGTARKPSEDYPNLPYQPTARKASTETGLPYGSGNSNSSQQGQATAGVIIPNKSMIAEEEIKVPFGHAGDDDESPSSSRLGSPDGMRVSLQSASTNANNGPRSPDGRSPLDRLGQAQAFGLNALGANLVTSPKSDEDDTGSDRRAPSEYFDKMSFGRASVQSDVGSKAGGRGHRQSVEDAEQLRRDYEFKIATMQNRMASLEGSIASANKARDDEIESKRELEEEIRSLRDASSKQAADIQRLQQELEETLESKDREIRRADSDRRELTRLQERILELETEQQSNGGNAEMEDSLRKDIQGLLDALQETGARNEELMADKEADMVLVQTLNSQVKEYKRKYEQAKTELRNNKATSQIFGGVQTAKMDLRRMPIAETGIIADIHVTTFQSSVDNLLSVARSENPGNVLGSMKGVVNAVSSVIDDVKSFEHNPNRFDISEDTVRHLRERCEATLQNLVSAARNHASSFGLSPVSLMDAAASHVSAAIIDLVRLLLLRRSTAADREHDRDIRETTRSPTEYSSIPNSNSNHSYKMSLRSIDETRMMSPHARAPSSGSTRVRDEEYQHSTPSTAVTSPLGGALSPPGSQQNFDDVATAVGGVSDDATTLAGSDNSWAELKPYLDAQSESLVYNIQNLLNSIRRGSAMAELDENLTQIISIVSSIVAVCKDSFPVGSVQRGGEILRELSDNCNKLSEMQSSSTEEITKTTRTAMAAASFGVAKAMKELMKL